MPLDPSEPSRGPSSMGAAPPAPSVAPAFPFGAAVAPSGACPGWPPPGVSGKALLLPGARVLPSLPDKEPIAHAIQATDRPDFVPSISAPPLRPPSLAIVVPGPTSTALPTVSLPMTPVPLGDP